LGQHTVARALICRRQRGRSYITDRGWRAKRARPTLP